MTFAEYVGLTLAVIVGTTVGQLAALALWFHFHGGAVVGQ